MAGAPPTQPQCGCIEPLPGCQPTAAPVAQPCCGGGAAEPATGCGYADNKFKGVCGVQSQQAQGCCGGGCVYEGNQPDKKFKANCDCVAVPAPRTCPDTAPLPSHKNFYQDDVIPPMDTGTCCAPEKAPCRLGGNAPGCDPCNSCPPPPPPGCKPQYAPGQEPC